MLQFPANTKEQRVAGYLLNQLGRRKSAVVVKALNEYAGRHPEVWTEGLKSNAAPTAARPAAPPAQKQAVPIPEKGKIEQDKASPPAEPAVPYREPVIEPAAPPAQKPDGPSPETVRMEPVAGYRQPQGEKVPVSEPDSDT